LSILTKQEAIPLNVTAIAEEDTDLVKLPMEAFTGVMEKFPSAVTQIVQVILTRFQRVTFATLNKYFGLTVELISVEGSLQRSFPPPKPISEMTSSELRACISHAIGSLIGISKSTQPASASSSTTATATATGESAASPTTSSTASPTMAEQAQSPSANTSSAPASGSASSPSTYTHVASSAPVAGAAPLTDAEAILTNEVRTSTNEYQYNF